MRFAVEKRLLLLVAMAALVGGLAGGAAYLLVRLISFFTNLALFGRLRWGAIPSLSEFEASPRLVVAAVVGALVVSLLALWAPIIRGHGIPEAMEAVLSRQSRVQPRAAVAKPVSAAVAIGTGAPFGAEGPIIVTGGALGSLIGQVVPVSPSERKILLCSGAAAGMAATFGAPLASVLLAIELLLFELSIRSFIPLVVAASIAGGIHSAVFGTGPLFVVPAHEYAGLTKLPLFGLLGLACGVVAVVVAQGLFLCERSFERLPIRQFWHPVAGALAFASIGLAVPRSLGVGYDVIDDVLAGELALGALTAVFVAKTLAWWLALASGTSGGTLAPVLLIGAAFGGTFAAVALEIDPNLDVTLGAFAVVSMAATFGAAARAPFTAMVFVFELTRDFEIVLPLMLATVLAALVFTALSPHSIYTEKLSRRGIRVGSELKTDLLRTRVVSDVMNRVVETVPPTESIKQIADRFARGGRGAYPIVDDDGRCVGIITRRDLLAQQFDDNAAVTTVASRDVVTVGPHASLLAALQVMLDEQVGHLPVVDDDILIGICTRADILRAHGDELALERLEPGWLAPVIQRQNRPGRRRVIVANKTLCSDALMAEISRRAEADPSMAVHVVVPLEGDDDLVGARERLERHLGFLEGLGLEATGEISDNDPLGAISATLSRGPAKEILLSTLPPGRSRWLRTDVPTRAARRFDVPVVHIVEDDAL